jgi:hypothetical protein
MPSFSSVYLKKRLALHGLAHCVTISVPSKKMANSSEVTRKKHNATCKRSDVEEKDISNYRAE